MKSQKDVVTEVFQRTNQMAGEQAALTAVLLLEKLKNSPFVGFVGALEKDHDKFFYFQRTLTSESSEMQEVNIGAKDHAIGVSSVPLSFEELNINREVVDPIELAASIYNWILRNDISNELVKLSPNTQPGVLRGSWSPDRKLQIIDEAMMENLFGCATTAAFVGKPYPKLSSGYHVMHSPFVPENMIATVHTNPTAPSMDAAIYLVVGTPTVEIHDCGVIVRYGFVTPDPARIMWWRVVPDGEEPVRDVEAEAYLRQIGDTGLRKHNYSDVTNE